MRPIKKIAQDVDNSSNYSEKRYKMICQIQQLLKEGCSYREIARRMGVGRNTIAKYRTGDPRELSMYGIHQSKLDIYHDFILECLYSGKSKSKTVKAVYAKGYTGSKSKSFTSFSPSCMGCIQKVFYKHKRGGSILSVKFSRYSVYQKWDYLLIVL